MESNKIIFDLEEIYDFSNKNQQIERIDVEKKYNEIDLIKKKYEEKKELLEQTLNLNQKELNNRLNRLQANTFLKPINVTFMLIAIYLSLEYKNNLYFNPVLPSLLFLYVFSDYFIRKNDISNVKQRLVKIENQYNEHLCNLKDQQTQEIKTIIDKLT
ncbi:hypothetical protein [Bacillus sp. AK128]